MKKILLIRFSSIGDIVLTTPVIRSVKEQLKAELHMLTKKQYATITDNNPSVDKVYVFEESIGEIIQDLKSESYDYVIDLQKNLRSLKVRKKLGRPSGSFPKLNKEKWMLVNLRVNRLPGIHIVDRYFEAVDELDVKNDGMGLDYFIPQKDEVNPTEIDDSLAEGFVGFVIGSRHHTKMLPVSKVAEIINKLDYPVILLGGPEDRENGKEILSLTENSNVLNACGNFTLNQSASLVRQARVVISNDTGLMHIAAAFEKPIISVWGNTVTDFGMYPYLPGAPEKSIIAEVEGLSCRPCSKLGFNECPKKHFKCMMDQDVEEIVNKAIDLFERYSPKSA